MNSRSLKEQTKYWDKVLADSGFVDIEQRDGNLKAWSASFFSKYHTPTVREAKQQYYRAVGHFLYEHPFKTEVERRIWTLHSEGVSVRETEEILKKEKLWFTKAQLFEMVIWSDVRTLTKSGAASKSGRNRKLKPNKSAIHLIVKRLVKLMFDQIERDNASD